MARRSSASVLDTQQPSRKPNSKGLRGLPAAKFPHEKMLSELGKKDSRSQRVAYFLDWAAREQPYHYQPFNVIVTVIQNYGALRRIDSEEVVSLRQNMHTIRKVLQTKYVRDLDIVASGARATVDDEDTASVTLPKKMRRLRSAKNSVMATYELVDVTKIKDQRVKAYLNRSVKDVIRMVGTDDFDKKLLPPSSDSEK